MHTYTNIQKRFSYIGITNSTNDSEDNAIYLESLLSPEEIKNNKKLSDNDFIHFATNNCGRDSIERICRIFGVKPNKGKIKLKEIINIDGYDYDFGHKYGWSVPISYLLTLDNNKNNKDINKKIKRY